MSIQKDSIQVIFQTYHFGRLKDEISQMLASDVDFRIKSILQDASKFMKHSKRKSLSVEDINHALKLKNIGVYIFILPSLYMVIKVIEVKVTIILKK